LSRLARQNFRASKSNSPIIAFYFTEIKG